MSQLALAHCSDDTRKTGDSDSYIDYRRQKGCRVHANPPDAKRGGAF